MNMAVEMLNTKAEQGFADHYEAVKPALPGADAAWASALRTEAMGVYSAAGLPHRRIEEWKYTDLRSHLSEAFAPSPAAPPALTGEDIGRLLGGLGGDRRPSDRRDRRPRRSGRLGFQRASGRM